MATFENKELIGYTKEDSYYQISHTHRQVEELQTFLLLLLLLMLQT